MENFDFLLIIKHFIIGIVQGFTEPIPVSSRHGRISSIYNRVSCNTPFIPLSRRGITESNCSNTQGIIYFGRWKLTSLERGTVCIHGLTKCKNKRVKSCSSDVE